MRLQTGADPSPPPATPPGWDEIDITTVRVRIDGRWYTAGVPSILAGTTVVVRAPAVTVRAGSQARNMWMALGRPAQSDGFTLDVSGADTTWNGRSGSTASMNGTVTRNQDGASRSISVRVRIYIAS